MTTTSTTPKHLRENYMVVFVGDINDGKSFQCDSVAVAKMPDGSAIIDGILWISTETSTSGTARCWADTDRVHVVRCGSAKDVAAALRKFLPVPPPPQPAGAEYVPRLPSGRRIDAVVLDSITGVFRAEQSIVQEQLRLASEAHDKKKRLNVTSGERSENDNRTINKHAASHTCEVVDALHAAAASMHLLALVTCHSELAFVDVEERNPMTGKMDKVPEWTGQRLDASRSVLKKLRAAANAIWFMHSVLPDFGGMDARLINAARHKDDPKLHRRYAAITDRGIYPGKIGDLGDVCKRQGDREGTPWQRAFGAAVPTWWHPDFVEVGREVPCAQPNFGKVLEFACASPTHTMAP